MEIDKSPKSDSQMIFLDNMSEDVWSFIEALEDEDVRKNEILENSVLTDRQYLGVTAEKLEKLTFIAPRKIDSTFVDYVVEVLGAAPANLLVPKEHSGQLSEDVMADSQLMANLMTFNGSKLVSYCSSLPFYRLVKRIEGVAVPEAPVDEDKWQQTVGTFGTKCGLRQALSNQVGVLAGIMPIGAVVEGKEAIIAQAIHLARTGKGVVIKTNKGHAGMGVVIITPQQLKANKSDLLGFIKHKLVESNGYWDKFPAVVEEYIQTDIKIGGGFPNIECLVDEQGRVEVLYSCGMRVDRGVFAGVEICADLLPRQVLDQMHEVGQRLGGLYAQRGYRGYFDVDFMAAMSGRLYISESNVRRTGGTWVIMVAKRLFGTDYLMNRCYVTNMIDLPIGPKWDFANVLNKLKPILINRETGRDSGVILASANLISRGKLNYMIVAKNRIEAVQIENKIKILLV